MVPEFRSCIGESKVNELLNSNNDNEQAALQSCFFDLMSAPDYLVSSSLEKLLNRLSTLSKFHYLLI